MHSCVSSQSQPFGTDPATPVMPAEAVSFPPLPPSELG
jgi:hypothetical protein